MIQKRFGLIILFVFSAIMFFSGCDEDSTDPILGGGGDVEAPTNVKVTLDAPVGGGAYALITWNSSTDENDAEFTGYVVVTDSVNINGNPVGRFDSAFVAKTAADLYTVTNITRGRLFKTLVYGVNNSGGISEAAQSLVYSGVYSGSAEIDEFDASAEAQSAFGWDPATGLGTQYPYSSDNAGTIDIHVRDNAGTLTLYSPGAVPSGPISPARVTQFALLGQGGDAYNLAVESYDDLTEPTLSSIPVADENVYLIKTQDNIYIKLWVTDITETTFSTVQFTYKVQPVSGLKILKR